MSTYKGKIKHPVTGEIVEAWFIDDYFGNHNYGVRPIDNDERGEEIIIPGKKVYKIEMVKIINE